MLGKLFGCNKKKALRDIEQLLRNPHDLTPQNVDTILNRSGFAGIKRKLIQNDLKSILERFLRQAAKDRRFSKNEKIMYEKLKEVFGISDEEAKKILSAVLTEEINKYIKLAIEDGDWSPEEEKELLAFAKSFNVDLKLDKETENLLKRLRFVWKLNSGILPNVSADVKLKKDETCHFKEFVQLGEIRKRVIKQSYSGPRISFRIAKGIYLSHGTLYRHRDEKEVLEFVDEGYLYLTNKRLIFRGNKKTISLQLQNILDVTFYKDGMQVFKGSGRPLFFSFEPSDEFCLLFNKLWNEA